MSESTAEPDVREICRRAQEAWERGDYVAFVAADEDARALEGADRRQYIARLASLGGSCC